MSLEEEAQSVLDEFFLERAYTPPPVPKLIITRRVWDLIHMQGTILDPNHFVIVDTDTED